MPKHDRPDRPGDKKPLTISNLKQVSRIFAFIRPYRVSFSFAALFLFIGSLAGMIVPDLMGRLIDSAHRTLPGLIGNTTGIALALIAILLVQAGVSYFRVTLFASVTERAMASVRRRLYDHLMILSIGFFEERRVGEVTSRTTNDVDQMQDLLSDTLPNFVRVLVTIVIGITFLFLSSVRLTLLTIAVIPVLVVGAMIYGRFIRKLSKQRQDALAATNVIVEETLQNIHTVKAFSNEAYESRRYGVSLQKVVETGIRGAVNRGAFSIFLVCGLLGSFTLVLWYGTTLMKTGQLTPGALTSFMLYTAFIGGAVAQFGDLFGRLQRTIGASERVFEILGLPGEMLESSTGPEVRAGLEGDIVLDHVHFAYPTRPDVEVLKGISLHIRPGQKVALAGQSGAGKSTIAQLILQFHRPTEGRLLFDGKTAAQYDLRALRQDMAIVPQEVILFGGTIRENIAYGRPGAGDGEIREAARRANALGFIEGFPDGLDTVVGERGIKLSGGQRQRIAIARAILKDPAVLILDEATSSLDSESEHLVQEALETLMRDRTTLIIAHRLSTIRNADEICVLQEGKIVESGTYDELAERPGGVFQNLLRLQREGQKGRPETSLADPYIRP